MAVSWSDVAGVIGKVAPTAEGLLATFGGPPGMIAAGAIKAATMVFGLSETAKPDELITAISADPQAALKLALAEQDFKLRTRDQDIEIVKAQLLDVQSARARDVDTTKATGKRDSNMYVLAWTVIIGFFVLILFLLYNQVPKDQNGVIFMLFGALATGFGNVLQYFFGSSQSSQDKTNIIARAEPIK